MEIPDEEERLWTFSKWSELRSHAGTAGGGTRYPSKKIALSQQMLHEGCPVRAETECPPLFLSGFVDQELTQDLQRIWSRLEKEARGVNGEVKLHSA